MVTKVKSKEMNRVDELKTEGAKNIISQNWTSLIKTDQFLKEEIGKNTFEFKVEPLTKGFGITLANALRRVMLSVLQGAAFSSVKIEGVDHEFSTITGVKEDVTDIVLNLKKVVIKYGGKEKKRVHLKAVGPCNVTAGMIEAPADVEIVNKDLVICTLDKDAKLNMELFISTGKGYLSVNENRSAEAPIGIIPMDSIFSPVKRVTFRVENSRVGSETEYDKLFLTIETNGSLSPDLALGLAAKVLQEQLQLFIGFDDKESEAEVQEDVLPFDINLLRKVADLELSVRSQNCLKNDNIVYIGDLVVKSESEMLRTPNFGRKSLNEIKELLSMLNLKFGMEVPGWPPENIEALAKKYEEQLG